MLKGSSARRFVKKADENLISNNKISFKSKIDIMKKIINKSIKKGSYGN